MKEIKPIDLPIHLVHMLDGMDFLTFKLVVE